MSTLSLKKPAILDAPKAAEAEPAVQAFTEDQLRAMLRDMQIKNGSIPTDPTMDLPTGEIPAHLIADRSALPPPEERGSAPAPQLAARRVGQFSINGIPVLASEVPASNVNPADGRFYTQIGPRPATQISPPPSRRFDGR